MASLFLAGLGAKLGLIRTYGNPLPFWDQWFAEAIELFVPYLKGEYSPSLLFLPHNEHRIVFTRICELLLLVANGQWDSQLEMTLNAVIHSAGIAGFGGIMASLLGKKYWPFIWLLLALCLCLPFGWENTLWGFQSQFYFLLIFALGAIWGLGLHEAYSKPWLLGACAGVAGLFAMASGFLAPAAVLALIFFDLARNREDWRRHVPTLGVCAALVCLGWLLKTPVPEHHQFQAHSVGEFVISLGKNLAWPWPLAPWYALFNVFPLTLLAWTTFRSKVAPRPAERMIFGIGFWALLQCAAAAFARGADGATPAWRYMDLLAFWMLANFFSIAVLLERGPSQLRLASCWKIAFGFWVLGCLGGLGYLSARTWQNYLPAFVMEQKLQLIATREFMASGDPRVFADRPTAQRLVLNVDANVWLLSHPLLRAILPACARDGLPLVPVKTGGGGNIFTLNGAHLAEADPPTETCWGSYPASTKGASGKFESEPLKQTVLPYLMIPVAGDLGQPGTSLELVEAETGAKTAVVPPQNAGGHWTDVCVKAPAGAFKLVATVDGGKWFAFKSPRELGRLSHGAMELLSCWKYFLAAGVGWFLVNLMLLSRLKPRVE